MKKFVLFVVFVIVLLFLMLYHSLTSINKQFETCTLVDFDDAENINFRKYDSVNVEANTLYKGDWVKRFMQGEQYREAWSTTVTGPVVFLDTLMGGLKIIEEGGGRQTHSLEVEDSYGIRYTFRSIYKDPSKLIPDIAYDLGLENIVVDGVSAQHPYSAVVVAKLAESIELLHTNPKIYFLPKQEQLKNFNEKYGNRLYLFEYESEGAVNWTPYKNIIELIDTEDVQQKKSEGEKININVSLLIRARLFDLIIGDWDRHAKQWGWAIEQRRESLLAHPIPADRDNAFFKLEGLVTNIISNDLTLPEIQSLKNEIDNIPALVQPFDEYFLKGIPESIFVQEAEKINKMLTDVKIEQSFGVWPTNIQKLDAEEIIRNIKSRRDNIVSYSKSFYQILQERELKDITLQGSEDLNLKGTLSKCFDCMNN